MKLYFFTIITALLSSTSFAEQIRCTAYANLPALSLYGSCYSGSCSLRSGSGTVYATGRCSDGSSFNASAVTQMSFAYGQCYYGQLSVHTSGYSLNWRGTCSNGGTFAANSSYFYGSSGYGRCDQTGMASVYISGESVNVEATCEKSDR